MRTFVIVVGLVALALAAGGSFVVRAQDGGAATLEVRCDPAGALPSGVDTLLTCGFTAHNTGSAVLVGLQLTLQANAGLLPDAYYFLSGTRDGATIPVTPAQTTYEYGDLAPGASSTIALKVIVRSAHPYDADALLQAGSDFDVYARESLGRGVAPAGEQPLAMKIAVQPGTDGESSRSFDLSITNQSSDAIDELLWVVTWGKDERLINGNEGSLMKDVIGSLQPGETYRTTITFEPSTGECDYVQPVVLAGTMAVHFLDPATNAPEMPSAVTFAESAAMIGPCTGQGGGGGAVVTHDGTASPSALPNSGGGAAEGRREYSNRQLLSGAVALGVLLAAAGLSVRRVRRR